MKASPCCENAASIAGKKTICGECGNQVFICSFCKSTISVSPALKIYRCYICEGLFNSSTGEVINLPRSDDDEFYYAVPT
jgi:hypothetical protein